MKVLNLRTALSPWNPWIVLKNKTEAQGVILDLYDKLKGSGTVDFTYQYDAPYGGFIGPDGKWNGMIGDMINNVTDLAGPIFINEARAKAVDFAFPVDFSQLVIITGLVPAHKDPFLIFGVFPLAKLVNTRLESVFERIKKNLIKMDKGIPPWLDAVEAGKAAYIADTLYAKSIIGERFRVTGKCNIRVSTFDLCSGYIGLACRKGLKKKFLRSLDNGILRFNEGKLAKRHMLESVLFYEICSQNVPNVIKPLDLTDLVGAFTVFGTGICLSLIYFVIELVMNFRK
ncbi:hypothetical protein HNY73_001443 [Argiope bruennichi]|uniref:Ionotropic glutamate receptor L-glutamate and glycine-binding domain-containing protein n=1 Tax=Argiope bruennichi TaxID=94029 RepID=A0A8T0G2J7_ARGBR|nr:hypothetical protein HNY73_001443 [Argiope bruennichi]